MGDFSKKEANIIASCLLVLMFFLAVLSVQDDSATYDEISHISAGYSYLTKKELRVNPEHPPLIKDLAALPLLFLEITFPEDHSSWRENTNDQWSLGRIFFYFSGNNADKILFWSRIPMILIMVFLGGFIFYWTRELAGNQTALLALTLFTFCPNFLAHGRLVTTDVGATLGFVMATYFYLKFLKAPKRKNMILSGLSLSFALLTKFSTLLLLPFLAMMTLLFLWLNQKKMGEILNYLKSICFLGLMTLVVTWLVYQFHILNYPVEKQLKDAQSILGQDGLSPLDHFCLWMMNQSVLRPLAHYFLGFIMAFQRATLPSIWPTYFLGETFRSGIPSYFPIIYILKTPLAFHILFLTAFSTIFWQFKRNSFLEIGQRFKKWTFEHFIEISMIIFLFIYWYASINSKVNIGIRHILPVLPFTYILVSIGINNLFERIKVIKFKKAVLLPIALLLTWYVASSFSSFPYYLTYFNEIVGGPKHGYRYAVDSNLDWGQDLKRLAQWIESQGIKKIYIDYFGGGEVKYYLGEKAIPWYGSSWWSRWSGWHTLGAFPRPNYFAVSATFLQGGRGKPSHDLNWPSGEYIWLNNYQPIAKIGNSIFVYYIY
jgi:hypothetical protein